MKSLSVVWSYVKKYWSYVALLGGTLVAFFLLRKQGTDTSGMLKELQAAHDDEVKAIQAVREDEKQKHKENEKKLQETLVAVQRHYDDAKEDLDEKKKAQIKEIVDKYGDDPNELAKKLSDATGFKIVMPE